MIIVTVTMVRMNREHVCFVSHLLSLLAACNNGHFYCRNIGHVGKSVDSSRVNDGICGTIEGWDSD